MRRRSDSTEVARAVQRVRELIAPRSGWTPPSDTTELPAVDVVGLDDEEPSTAATWRTGRARIDPGRRSMAAFIVTAIASATIAVGATVLTRPSEPEVAAAPPTVVPITTAASTAAVTPSATTSAAQIVVSVVGKVAKPGLVTLPVGARVSDALEACGGALPGTDLTSLNLAQKLADGQQIAVGVAGTAPGGVAGGDGASGGTAVEAPGAPINLNTASAAELEELPGIGPVLAQRIVDFRTANGPFATVEDLSAVPGVGPAIMGNIESLVTV